MTDTLKITIDRGRRGADVEPASLYVAKDHRAFHSVAAVRTGGAFGALGGIPRRGALERGVGTGTSDAGHQMQQIGPFIVASDMTGDCLFERENAQIAKNVAQIYEGTKPAILKRYGESDDRTDKVI